MVQGICLYSPWRQQARQAPHGAEQAYRFPADRPLARGKLELRRVGALPRGVPYGGKLRCAEAQPLAQGAQAHIYGYRRNGGLCYIPRGNIGSSMADNFKNVHRMDV